MPSPTRLRRFNEGRPRPAVTFPGLAGLVSAGARNSPDRACAMNLASWHQRVNSESSGHGGMAQRVRYRADLQSACKQFSMAGWRLVL